jgi:hypothetical protein
VNIALQIARPLTKTISTRHPAPQDDEQPADLTKNLQQAGQFTGHDSTFHGPALSLFMDLALLSKAPFTLGFVACMGHAGCRQSAWALAPGARMRAEYEHLARVVKAGWPI